MRAAATLLRRASASAAQLRPRRPLALVRIQEALAQPDRLRRHLDHLVVVDVCDRLLQRRALRRGQADLVVLAAACAEVGQCLGLHRVDLEVVRLGVLADDHALVQRLAVADEQDAALLERTQRVVIGFARAVRDEHAVLAALDVALERAIALEQWFMMPVPRVSDRNSP